MKIDHVDCFNNVFSNKKVLITGDTGFKGSWLATWLVEMGAEVFGYSLPPKTEVDNYLKINLANKITHIDGDIRDLTKLSNYFAEVKPEIAFHLAAQPLVLESYSDPVFTFETNIIGTVNFLESVRKTPSVKTALIITSDKCYQNNEWIWGYRESDPMGGTDPYSASKGCAELVTGSYIKSFFSKPDSCCIASVRAGNVIGGGDWGSYRIVPDFFRALNNNEKLLIRNPYSTRPWQHVLEPLGGYLHLASKLFTEGSKYSGGWNFGPADNSNRTVVELITSIINEVKNGEFVIDKNFNGLHEANLLKLDISKAVSQLKWNPILDFNEVVKFTAEGYKAETGKKNLYNERKNQIKEYVKLAKEKNAVWAN